MAPNHDLYAYPMIFLEQKAAENVGQSKTEGKMKRNAAKNEYTVKHKAKLALKVR